jgi:hypothetical protein
MHKITIAPSYSAEYLEVDRPSPLVDNTIENLIQDVLSGKTDRNISDSVYTNFKSEMINWIEASSLNSLIGLSSFTRVDIINGCTQFIDNLYMQSSIQVIAGDYRYHERLGNYYSTPGKLIRNMPLILAMPFPSTGAVHTQMADILEECLDKNIPIHIDGAWITCCRDITFDFSHPAICSVGISLSKGLGLGWNRIGLRWTRQDYTDSVTIMNDFRMNNRALVMIGLHFIRNLPIDYLWNTHSDRYYTVCNDFKLTPTSSIYLALRNNMPVGVSLLIRFLEKNSG